MLARVTRADGLVMDVNPNSIDIEKQLVQFGLNEYILPNSGAPHPAGPEQRKTVARGVIGKDDQHPGFPAWPRVHTHPNRVG